MFKNQSSETSILQATREMERRKLIWKWIFKIYLSVDIFL